MKSFLAILILGFSLMSCQETEDPIVVNQLSSAELETLLFTREEEKLAHDVYTYAFEKYGTFIFQNIGNSETQHVNSVLAAMNSFDVADPLMGSTAPGIFTIPALSNLYQTLITRVNISQKEALLVGLYIEDLDINDLNNALAETQIPQLIRVYENLKCGSNNHMRSFENLASTLGVTYDPEFISLELYNSIINSPLTTCGNL
ncbi:MAG: DUF2202 domain-containing protein [Algoriphagus sp.]|nr:DUF2202 domain-containing protein [Algoriphagus sp.]